ncbi:hypothetical protein DKX38_004538 [Salix brachista]|uniref:Uncharacterized protein n=1 Tax=Salix brachista TaxID=2182728 RepID=A0A5N5NAE6_9ROSI|nr:hypothetical protein DKX38_004538 [Salix brachista]
MYYIQAEGKVSNTLSFASSGPEEESSIMLSLVSIYFKEEMLQSHCRLVMHREFIDRSKWSKFVRFPN